MERLIQKKVPTEFRPTRETESPGQYEPGAWKLVARTCAILPLKQRRPRWPFPPPRHLDAG